MFIVNTLIESASCKKSTLFLCHVDFRKAFDSVDHYCCGSWSNWESVNKLTILQSMYSKVMSRVKLSNYEVTDQFCCEVETKGRKGYLHYKDYLQS